MSWIDLPGDEEGVELTRLTKRFRDDGRAVPSILAVMKPNPRAFRAVSQMNGAVTFGGSVLGRVREECIATSTSALNDCFY